MNLSIPEIRVDPPMCCEGISLFPLFSDRGVFPEGDSAFVLAAEAIAAGTCIVREVSEEGSVSELLVDNASDTPVLFLEGEVLRGAKQDRVLRSSVLVAGGGHTRVPVCCVERGRWEYAGRRFAPGSCCPPTMRLLLKQAAHFRRGRSDRRSGVRVAGDPPQPSGDGDPFRAGEPVRHARRASRQGGRPAASSSLARGRFGDRRRAGRQGRVVGHFR